MLNKITARGAYPLTIWALLFCFSVAKVNSRLLTFEKSEGNNSSWNTISLARFSMIKSPTHEPSAASHLNKLNDGFRINSLGRAAYQRATVSNSNERVRATPITARFKSNWGIKHGSGAITREASIKL